MLKINDLTVSKELARGEMAEVVGGNSELERLSALIDFSTSTTNKVADVNQIFGLSLAQGNAGAVINNQTIVGGNGFTDAPVTQDQVQDNYMSVYGVGNTSVS
jgi:hypothetical protein